MILTKLKITWYVHTYIHTCTHTYIHAHSTYARTYILEHYGMCIHAYVHTYPKWSRMCIHTYVHTYMHIEDYVACAYMPSYTRLYIYIYIYIHTHTHTYYIHIYQRLPGKYVNKYWHVFICMCICNLNVCIRSRWVTDISTLKYMLQMIQDFMK